MKHLLIDWCKEANFGVRTQTCILKRTEQKMSSILPRRDPFAASWIWILEPVKNKMSVKSYSYTKTNVRTLHISRPLLRNPKRWTKTRIDLAKVHTTYVFLFKFLGQSFELLVISIFVVPRSFPWSFTGLHERERKKFISIPGNQNQWHVSAAVKSRHAKI